ncbi:MAG: SGNH/GDSL hydrolase family protein [Victivallaceae bacterium]|nr:SGNH/GDSL hydrolase family protein [Victivallaceae bacterium]
MEINLLDNGGFVFGVASYEYHDGAYRFFRMTDGLNNFFGDNEGAVIRALNTSGVRIGFITDSESLAMEVLYGKFSRPIFTIDVIVNGEHKMTFSPDTHVEKFSFSTELPGTGEKTVEIFLPVMAECAVKGIVLDPGSRLEAMPEKPERILFTGDSITQGMTVTTPALTYPAQAAAVLKADFHNVAVGGATMQQEIAPLLLELEWQKVFIAFGVNDFSQDRFPDVFGDEIRGMLKTLSTREAAEIFLITPIPWALRTNPNSIGLFLEDYREVLRETAKSFPKVKVIEGAKLVPDDPEYYVDNIHPNDLGASEYADNLLAELGVTD